MLKKTCLMLLIFLFCSLTFAQEKISEKNKWWGRVGPTGIKLGDYTLYHGMSLEQAIKVLNALNFKITEPFFNDYYSSYHSFIDADSNTIVLTWHEEKLSKISFSKKMKAEHAYKNIEAICQIHQTFGPRKNNDQFLDVVYYDYSQKKLCVLIEFDLSKKKFLIDCYKQAFSK